MEAGGSFCGQLLPDRGVALEHGGEGIPAVARGEPEQQAQREADTSGQSLHLAEREVIGFDHARVASVLMKNWKLPESLVAVIENHLEPDPKADYLLDTAILHIAALIGNAFAHNRSLDEILVAADPHAWDATGLDTGSCEAVNAEVVEQLNSVVDMLFPTPQRKVG